jgi:hypothetical protein
MTKRCVICDVILVGQERKACAAHKSDFAKSSARLRALKWAKDNPEKAAHKAALYRANNPTKVKERYSRDKPRKIAGEIHWRRLNRDRVLSIRRKSYYKKKQAQLDFKLIRSQLNLQQPGNNDATRN